VLHEGHYIGTIHFILNPGVSSTSDIYLYCVFFLFATCTGLLTALNWSGLRCYSSRTAKFRTDPPSPFLY